VLLSGTFTLSINEEVTAPVSVYDDGEAIRSKLEALPSIGSLSVVRTASAALAAPIVEQVDAAPVPVLSCTEAL